MLRHRINLGIQLPLNLNNTLLILFSDKVYRESDLPKTTTAANPVQIDTTLGWKVKIDDHVDRLNIDPAGNQIGADQCLELSLSESLKDPYSLIAAHVGMQALVLILFFIQFS